VNKQLVNLIGAVASLAILALGVLVFALPLFSSAGATAASADDVAAQNRAQQTVLDTLTAQSADMTELDATVAELRAEIPEAAHLDDVLLLAVEAAQAHGGAVTTVTPATPEAFAPRVVAADDAGSAPAAGEAEPAPEPSPSAEASATEATEAPTDAATAPAADAPQQVAVTVVVDAPDVAAATRIVDALREGPRLVAVTQASVTTPAEGGATLTVTLLAFYRP
jgi:hypothetical protein